MVTEKAASTSEPWCASINLGWQGGKRKRKRKHFFLGRTRKEVQEKLTEALRNYQQGLPAAPSCQTVEQYLTSWVWETARPTVRARTFESYELVVRKHLVPDFGRTKLGDLSPQRVQALLNRKLQSGLSPRTVEYIRTVLVIALNVAVRWGLVPRNVALLVPAPRVERHEVRPLSPDDAQKLLEAVKGDRLEALFTAALAVGLRLGEGLGLSWSDVEFEKGTITVRQQVQRIGGKVVLVEPKTKRSRRTIALPEVAVEALRERKVRQYEERLLAADGWVDTGLIFTTRKGTPLEPRNARKAFHELLERAGLPRIRFHDLRHACASLMLAQHVHPRVVMEILGHNNISMTMDLYSHVMPEVQREAAASMDRVLRPAVSRTGA